ncbi:hypothetical protein BGW42_003567 [Actinomortierella wolfii]|nr:hypothetical protein BGW42_003567 [Actinomortierella wolfii]
MYNVSRFMRSISGPLLARFIATMSPRLFLYQEYVRRIGIRFVFEGIDFERDIVVFRPLNMEHQHRFRNELTLQCPQLEELTVSMLQEAPRVTRHDQYQHIFVAVPKTRMVTSGKQQQNHQCQEQHQQQRQRHHQNNRRSSVDISDRIFHSGSNFLDKACPLRAKKSGIAMLDGTRYSFGKDYPWRLYYQIDREPLPAASQSRFHFHKEGLLLDPKDDQNVCRSITSGGARYIRAVRFECSINFLNPRRASRNVVGRWIEHKLQQCLRVFGSTGLGYHFHHHQQKRPASPQEQKQQSQLSSNSHSKNSAATSNSPSSSQPEVRRYPIAIK